MLMNLQSGATKSSKAVAMDRASKKKQIAHNSKFFNHCSMHTPLLLNTWTYRSILYPRKAWYLPVYPSGWPLQCCAEAPYRKELPVNISCWEKHETVAVCSRRVNVFRSIGAMKSPKHFLSAWANGLIPCITGCLTNRYWVSEMPKFL